MRTAAICPTCATYENAACILYNGPYLPFLNISPLESLESALIKINLNTITSTGISDPTASATHLGQFYVNVTTGVIYYATSVGTGPNDWTIIGNGLGFTAENVVNKTTSASDIINFATSITKYPSVKSMKDYVDQSVANITLQTVLGNGHSLVDGINLQGTNAGGITLSGTNINAFGESSAYDNTGSDVNALGYLASYQNTGDTVNALGPQSGVGNSGSDLNALGFSAASGNGGSNVNSFGNSSGVSNTGSNINVFGNLAGNNNTANNVNAFGDAAGQGNTRNSVNLFGSGASATTDDQTVFVSTNGSAARIGYGSLTTSQLYTLPDNSGTIVLTSDIPTDYWKTGGNSGTTPGTDFIGTTDAQDLVFKTNSTEQLRISQATGIVYSKSGIDISATINATPTRIQVYQPTGFYSASIGQNTTDGGFLTLNGTTGFNTAVLKAQNLTATRNYQFPDAGGTLALQSYKVYSATVQFIFSSPDVQVLQVLENTTGATITLSYSFGSYLATASSSIFTANKSVMICTPYLQSSTLYNVVGSRVSDTVMSFVSIDTSDGSQSASFNRPFFLEIRVYP